MKKTIIIKIAAICCAAVIAAVFVSTAIIRDVVPLSEFSARAQEMSKAHALVPTGLYGQVADSGTGVLYYKNAKSTTPVLSKDGTPVTIDEETLSTLITAQIQRENRISVGMMLVWDLCILCLAIALIIYKSGIVAKYL